ncbi:hypothetical protein DEU56DRAFT_976152 [Suillus clintonianus]|uniref:uncharacterized protein n=1 Tax=Suillus clintonianus TaxID=1904413 RepID=UPI001B860432|nr:uncharacterized protein DEU56DRAFT_976152 [Suillus clintonianus]KAG2155571.1 hypothetical protein DEU56DRAFT_976152 [Suillus clintonianus]
MISTPRATRSTRRPTTPTPNQDPKENMAVTPQSNVTGQPPPEVRGDSSKKRHRMSSAQLMCLESLYQKDTHPSKHRKNQLADELGMDCKTITIWFQNKRQIAKRSKPSVSSSPLQIRPRNGVSKTPDHQLPVQSLSVLRRVSSPSVNDTLQPVILPSVCLEKSRTTPSPEKQERDVNNPPSKMSLQVKPLLSSLGSFMSSKSPKKDQVRPTMTSRTNAQELWQHLPSSPTAPSSVSDRGSEAYSPTRDEKDTPCSKRGLTLEWACDRQTKRRRAGKDNGSDTDNSSRLWLGSSDRHTNSALSLLSLAAGKVSTPLSADPAPSQDVMRGASLLLSFKHSLRGRDTGKKRV